MKQYEKQKEHYHENIMVCLLKPMQRTVVADIQLRFCS